jgi:hypothetical protein
MTTATNPYPDVALPSGAHTYGWDDDPDSDRRTVYGDAHLVESERLAMTAFASQRRDGSIINQVGDRALVYLDQIEDDGTHRDCLYLPPAAARQLAEALLATAAEVEGWVRSQTD